MLAIIIPYFKLSFFEETLQSLAHQTDRRFKVYIGDDAGPENPRELIEKYQDNLNLVYHRFETNLGGTSLVQQWERCIDLSVNEEWIMILGDDDVLGTTCIAEFYKYLPEIGAENCKVVRFATEIIDEQSKPTSTKFIHPKVEKVTDFFYRRFMNKTTRSSLSEYIFKRSTYKKYGFYDYNLAWFADDRAWLEFSEFKNVYSINTAIVSFRLSTVNISRGNYKLQEKEAVQLQFYNFLVSRHIGKFKSSQQRHLLLFYEQLIYKNKKASFSFWILVFLSFFKRFDVIQCVKFTRRVFIHLRSHA